ncbi:hypothetical protein CTAYLR_002231 [Chrysophaeum taylorii]|uniref:Mitochondrial inner membrane protease subunit 2 n=1 Tax=Chrysophaeum taylorii TaxID=2483200 RepID=A0AAD7UQ81_9STRA|nr:hypothetical protein CTAYLR_002231 [Chrysophaeum taylorii]
MAMRRRLVTVPVVALAFHDQIATVKTADAQMVLVDRGFLRRVPWRRHDVVVVRSPCDRRQVMIANLRHLEGECARPLTQGDFLTWTPVPRGHCWIEGDDPKGGDSTEGASPRSSGRPRGCAGSSVPLH